MAPLLLSDPIVQKHRRFISVLSNFSDQLIALLFKGNKKNWPAIIVFYLALLSPVVLVSVLSYLKSREGLTDLALSRRESIAHLAAEILEQRFNRLTDIAVSLASRVRFRQLITDNKWDEAIRILSSVFRDFPFVDAVILTDPSGTLMAESPEFPNLRAESFAFTDWYTGVSRNGQAYISDVYTRAGEPRYNVIAVATPIRAEDKKIIGLLTLQIRVESLFEWSKGIQVGTSGFAYFVDKKGHIAAHPKYPAQQGIVDYSSVTAVQMALQGKRGVEVLFNPIEQETRVCAFALVPGYGWGVVAQEPVTAAFAARDENLRLTLMVYGLIILLNCIFAYLALSTLTKLKQSEAETYQLNTQLQAANKELEAFGYSVSHDLRAPARHIQAFATLLHQNGRSSLDEANGRCVDHILGSARQLSTLIDDLLELSRLGRTEIQKRQIDLNQMVNEVVKELESETDGRSIAWKIDPLPTVLGDRSMLHLALSNLISNAMKFTRTRPEARIEIGTENGEAGVTVIFVRDNGVGFDMRYAKKLFGVFQRLHSNDEFEGTGIGLASVQRTIHRHGGRTWAEAKVGEGATFYFSLPEHEKRH